MERCILCPVKDRRIMQLQRSLSALKFEKGSISLSHALHKAMLDPGTAKGQAFVAGWIVGHRKAGLQIPLLLEDQDLRNLFAAGFFAARGK